MLITALLLFGKNKVIHTALQVGNTSPPSCILLERYQPQALVAAAQSIMYWPITSLLQV